MIGLSIPFEVINRGLEQLLELHVDQRRPEDANWSYNRSTSPNQHPDKHERFVRHIARRMWGGVEPRNA